jgi:hypothetical protein
MAQNCCLKQLVVKTDVRNYSIYSNKHTHLFITLLILVGARVLLTGDDPGEKFSTETLAFTS